MTSPNRPTPPGSYSYAGISQMQQYTAWNECDMSEEMGDMFGALDKFRVTFVEEFFMGFSNIGDALDAAFSILGDTMAGIAGLEGVSQFIDMVQGAINTVTAVNGLIMGTIDDVITALWNGLACNGLGVAGDTVSTIADALSGLVSFSQVGEKLIAELRAMIEEFFRTVTGDAAAGFEDAADWIRENIFGAFTKAIDADTKAGQAIDQVAGAVDQAVDEAVKAVVDGMNDIGQFAATITAAMEASIRAIIESIFGDGGSKWGQEVYLAAGPVVLGANDIPLGFGMPYGGKIKELWFVSSNHAQVGGAGAMTIDLVKNSTVLQTFTWNGGSNSVTFTGLDHSVSKGDRVRLVVVSLTSEAADMSVSILGTYV